MLALGFANAEQARFVTNEAVEPAPTGMEGAAVARVIGQASVRALRILSAERALQTGWNIADSTGSRLTLETELEARALDSYPMAAPPKNTWLRLIFEFEAVGDDVRVTARAEETWWPVDGGPSSIDVTDVYRVQLVQLLAHLARRWRGGSAVDRLSAPVLRSDAPQEVRVYRERLRGRHASELLALRRAGKAVSASREAWAGVWSGGECWRRPAVWGTVRNRN